MGVGSPVESFYVVFVASPGARGAITRVPVARVRFHLDRKRKVKLGWFSLKKLQCQPDASVLPLLPSNTYDRKDHNHIS